MAGVLVVVGVVPDKLKEALNSAHELFGWSWVLEAGFVFELLRLNVEICLCSQCIAMFCSS